jgi:uncharacterized OsmC-like protein
MITYAFQGAYAKPIPRVPHRGSSVSRRIENSATTIDRGPADPFRAAVLVGANDAEMLRVSVDRALGGQGDAPSSGDLLCAALAASLDASIRVAASVAGIALKGLSVDVRAWTDVRGVLGTDRDVPVGFQTLLCSVRIETAAVVEPVDLRRVLVEAERASIVLATLRRAVPCHIRIEGLQSAVADAPLAKAA